MKMKLLVFLLLLSVCLGLLGCSKSIAAQPSGTDLVGTWVLDAVKLNGMTYVDSDHLDDYDYTFVFTQDGQATVTALGVSYTTSYEVRNGWITFAHADLASVKLQISGDTLEMDVNVLGSGLVFVKQADVT